MSHVTQSSIKGRLLKVKTRSGLAGIGEVTYHSSLHTSQIKDRIAAEPDLLRPLIGQSVDQLSVHAARLRAQGKYWGGFAFGVETAMFDLLAQKQNKPVAALLGKVFNKSVDDYFSISERSTEKIQRRVNAAGAGRKIIQLKLGVGSMEDDRQHVACALAKMGQHQQLHADANGGWTVESACELIAKFDDLRISWEEPCDNYDDNVQVARVSKQPIMVDQSIKIPEVARKAVTDGMVAAVCIKPSLLGGLTVAKDLLDLCIKTKTKLRIDGPWCGDVASAAILHLALCAPPEILIGSCDLREPLILNPDLHGVITHEEYRVSPPVGIGLGIQINEQKLGAPEYRLQT